jgi:hypothetical protein
LGFNLPKVRERLNILLKLFSMQENQGETLPVREERIKNQFCVKPKS